MSQVVSGNKIFGMGKGKKAVEDTDRSNAKTQEVEALVQDLDDDPDKQDGKRKQRNQNKDTQEGQLICADVQIHTQCAGSNHHKSAAGNRKEQDVKRPAFLNLFFHQKNKEQVQDADQKKLEKPFSGIIRIGNPAWQLQSAGKEVEKLNQRKQ